MSVQVRRRREAAAFLQSFVGAQGELLVDTTNNRVQIHDGTTPGGWPAAAMRDMAGFNLGINTNGGINQRGVSGTVVLAAGAYGHDRIKAGANGCTYTFSTAGNGDTTFTIMAGSLVQTVDVGNIVASALWLTWTGTAPARVYQGAIGNAPAFAAGMTASIDGTTVNSILQGGLALGTITSVEFGTGTLNTTRPWQLEVALPNAGPSRLARRHGEMALCQRYYEVMSAGVFGSTGNPSFVTIAFRFAVPKRATPTMKGLATALTLIVPGNAIYNSSSTVTYDFNQAPLDVTGGSAFVGGFSGLPLGLPLFLTGSNIAFASASAEL